MDFWLRNPDYLADELLTGVLSSRLDGSLLLQVEALLAGDEPDLSRYPMVRYLFGAFEPLDDALALLYEHRLVAVDRLGSGGRVGLHSYHLLQAGRDQADDLRRAAPVMRWYDERARLVAYVAAGKGGQALKDRQYAQAEYAATELGSRIRPITDRVRARLADVLSRAAAT